MANWHETIDFADYGKGNKNWAGMNIHPPVFVPTAAIALGVILFSILSPKLSADVFGWLKDGVVANFDGLLMMSGNAMLLFCIVLAVSPLGKIRLGGKESKPDYSYVAWFSMLFGAGMGIGLIFYGVAEPVTHFNAAMAGGPAAPLGGAPGNAIAAKDVAMAATVYNWALHPWAIYAVVGIALSVFSYGFKMPFTLRSAFYPLIGKRVWGRTGDVIDIIAVFATLFGLATSLGLGSQQAMSGISRVLGIGQSNITILILIAIMAFCTFFSLRGGIDKGIRILSEINMVVALVLMTFVVIASGAGSAIWAMLTNTVNYFIHMPALSNPVGRTDTGFYYDWTVYYWAWWIAWAPLVGIFMARISKGRTVREFMVCSLVAPSLLGLIWLTAFGESAISQIIAGKAPQLATASIDSMLFDLLATLPWTNIVSVITVALILIFYITGWDSGTLVLDTMTSAGATDTSLHQKVMWMLLVGGIGTVLLLSGGLNSLQAGSIATALPLSLVMLAMCVGTVKGLLVLHRQDA
jgi:betaine/carnitine transporter, BCCT family